MEKILQKKKAMEELEKVAKYVLAENILILSKINQETPTCVFLCWSCWVYCTRNTTPDRLFANILAV